jgi:hypothetical protein
MVRQGDFSAHVLLGTAKAEEFPPTEGMVKRRNKEDPYRNPLYADSFVEIDLPPAAT